MTWLNPWGWLWLGLAVPIILLHFLRIHRRRVAVSSTQFWEEILSESRPRAWWQRLRHLASLLLQLLLLLLLTAALADPLSASQSRERRLVVLLVDQSASMNAGDADQPSRLSLALRRAGREVDGLRDWDEALVLRFADEVQVACGRTAHPGVLRRALDAIQPTDRSGDPAAALDLANRLQAPGCVKEIVVFTDKPPPTEQANIRWHVVGEAMANLGVTALSASAHPDRSTEFRILTRLANFSPEERQVAASIRVDGQPIDGISAQLTAGESRTFVISKVLPQGGMVEVALKVDREEDGLAADNRAWLTIPPPQPVKVAVVSGQGNWFLERALSAVPLVEVIRRAPGQALGDTDLVVYDRVVPAELPPVHSFFLHPGEATALWTMAAPQKNVLISSIAEESPLLAYTRFERVTIRAAHPIHPVGGTTVMSSFGAPLLQVWDGSDVRRAALTLDLEQSDLALRTAFPILVANLVQWFTGQVSGPIEGLRTGAPGPDGPIERVGIFPGTNGTMCVNLLDPEESDLRLSEAVRTEDVSEDRRPSRPWWRWLALSALALVTVEWGLHQRRWVE